jgi:hypothetical protein
VIGFGAVSTARERELIEKYGEEKYARIALLERARLERVRYDWRFYTGAALGVAGLLLLVFKPNVKAATQRARKRIGTVTGGATERAGKRLGATFRRARQRVKG